MATDPYTQQIMDTSPTMISWLRNYNYPVIKEETKKEKVKRIAKEKMYASWKTQNNKTVSVMQLKQICKPAHRISYMGRKK